MPYATITPFNQDSQLMNNIILSNCCLYFSVSKHTDYFILNIIPKYYRLKYISAVVPNKTISLNVNFLSDLNCKYILQYLIPTFGRCTSVVSP